jgi:hypothetical protein
MVKRKKIARLCDVSACVSASTSLFNGHHRRQLADMSIYEHINYQTSLSVTRLL